MGNDIFQCKITNFFTSKVSKDHQLYCSNSISDTVTYFVQEIPFHYPNALTILAKRTQLPYWITLLQSRLAIVTMFHLFRQWVCILNRFRTVCFYNMGSSNFLLDSWSRSIINTIMGWDALTSYLSRYQLVWIKFNMRFKWVLKWQNKI